MTGHMRFGGVKRETAAMFDVQVSFSGSLMGKSKSPPLPPLSLSHTLSSPLPLWLPRPWLVRKRHMTL